MNEYVIFEQRYCTKFAYCGTQIEEGRARTQIRQGGVTSHLPTTSDQQDCMNRKITRREGRNSSNIEQFRTIDLNFIDIDYCGAHNTFVVGAPLNLSRLAKRPTWRHHHHHDHDHVIMINCQICLKRSDDLLFWAAATIKSSIF